MKSPERFLREWVTDRITFDAGGNGKLWSQDELSRLAAYLRGTKAIMKMMEATAGIRPTKKANNRWLSGVVTARVDWDLAKKAREALFAFDFEDHATAGWLAKVGSLKAAIRECSRNAKKEKRGPFHE